ncbi:hypothetical protein HDU93_001859 [Gonapodya sp. JEL0774]|nr:hypothetical protein HDU93_001859 [Gonapodya sp. JEL0774]
MAGSPMVDADFKDWKAWSCQTWFPGGIVKTCDSIYFAYNSGVLMTVEDYLNWESWRYSPGSLLRYPHTTTGAAKHGTLVGSPVVATGSARVIAVSEVVALLEEQ